MSDYSGPADVERAKKEYYASLSDLIERLRRQINQPFGHLHAEAADELERLGRELAEARRLLQLVKEHLAAGSIATACYVIRSAQAKQEVPSE